MIWRPKTGQKVIAHYRKSTRHLFPHGMPGIVVTAGTGKGPINALVDAGFGKKYVIPRGNLREAG